MIMLPRWQKVGAKAINIDSYRHCYTLLEIILQIWLVEAIDALTWALWGDSTQSAAKSDSIRMKESRGASWHWPDLHGHCLWMLYKLCVPTLLLCKTMKKSFIFFFFTHYKTVQINRLNGLKTFCEVHYFLSVLSNHYMHYLTSGSLALSLSLSLFKKTINVVCVWVLWLFKVSAVSLD